MNNAYKKGFIAGAHATAIQGEEIFESLLAEVIDDLYLKYKNDFCDYENKTHKLGWFKEEIKSEMAKRLREL